MTDRDLTPDEARAEVEAFMGEGWTHYVGKNDDETWVKSTHGYVTLFGCAPTLRPVVDALKAAWRDAVRPWMEAAIEAKLDTADVDGYAPDEVVIARVLKEGYK